MSDIRITGGFGAIPPYPQDISTLIYNTFGVNVGNNQGMINEYVAKAHEMLREPQEAKNWCLSHHIDYNTFVSELQTIANWGPAPPPEPPDYGAEVQEIYGSTAINFRQSFEGCANVTQFQKDLNDYNAQLQILNNPGSSYSQQLAAWKQMQTDLNDMHTQLDNLPSEVGNLLQQDASAIQALGIPAADFPGIQNYLITHTESGFISSLQAQVPSLPPQPQQSTATEVQLIYASQSIGFQNGFEKQSASVTKFQSDLSDYNTQLQILNNPQSSYSQQVAAWNQMQTDQNDMKTQLSNLPAAVGTLLQQDSQAIQALGIPTSDFSAIQNYIVNTTEATFISGLNVQLPTLPPQPKPNTATEVQLIYASQSIGFQNGFEKQSASVTKFQSDLSDYNTQLQILNNPQSSYSQQVAAWNQMQTDQNDMKTQLSNLPSAVGTLLQQDSQAIQALGIPTSDFSAIQNYIVNTTEATFISGLNAQLPTLPPQPKPNTATEVQLIYASQSIGFQNGFEKQSASVTKFQSDLSDYNTQLQILNNPQSSYSQQVAAWNQMQTDQNDMKTQLSNLPAAVGTLLQQDSQAIQALGIPTSDFSAIQNYIVNTTEATFISGLNAQLPTLPPQPKPNTATEVQLIYASQSIGFQNSFEKQSASVTKFQSDLSDYNTQLQILNNPQSSYSQQVAAWNQMQTDQNDMKTQLSNLPTAVGTLLQQDSQAIQALGIPTSDFSAIQNYIVNTTEATFISGLNAQLPTLPPQPKPNTATEVQLIYASQSIGFQNGFEKQSASVTKFQSDLSDYNTQLQILNNPQSSYSQQVAAWNQMQTDQNDMKTQLSNLPSAVGTLLQQDSQAIQALGIPTSDFSAIQNYIVNTTEATFISGLNAQLPTLPPSPSVPPPAPKEGFVPVVLANNGNNTGDVYVTVVVAQPTPGGGNNPEFLTFDQNGVGTYTTDPTKAVFKLSNLPKTQGGNLIYVPPGNSGRIYLSTQPLYKAGDSPSTGIPPTQGGTWNDIEYSFDQNNVMTMNCTSVDTSGSMPLKLEMDQSGQPTHQEAGFGGNWPYTLGQINTLLGQYGGSNWQGLVQNGRVIAPNLATNFDFSSLTNYLNQTYIPYYQTHTLRVEMQNGIDYSGLIDPSGKNFVFTAPGAATITIPLPTSDDPQAWFAPGTKGEFPTPGNDQGEITKMLSAMVTMGIRPQDVTSPLNETFFSANKSSFYKAAAYDVYTRVMHEAGVNEYAYSYDDLVGESGTEAAKRTDSLVTTITIGDFTTPALNPTQTAFITSMQSYLQSADPGTKALADGIVAYVQSLSPPPNSLNDIVNALKNSKYFNGAIDPYTAFGITQTLLTSLTQAISSTLSIPTPSQTDTIYSSAMNYMNNNALSPAASLLYTTLINNILTQPIDKVLQVIDNKFWETYPGLDPVLADKNAISQFIAITGASGFPPTQTPADTAYVQTFNYINNNTLTPAASKLFSDLLNDLKNIPSGQTVEQMVTALICNPQFWTTYPNFAPTGADAAAATEFTTITGVNIPAVPVTPLATVEQEVTTWQATLPTTPPGSINFAKALMTYLQSEPANVTLQKLQSDLQAKFFNQDLYFAYPGITITQINSLVGAVGGLTPQTATALDTAYATANNYTATSAPGTLLMTNLIAQLVAANSGGKTVTWAGQQIANDPNFWTTYVGLSSADGAEFTTITGVNIPAVPPSALSVVEQDVTTWQATLPTTPPGSRKFAADLTTFLQSEPSNVTLQKLQSDLQAKFFNQDLYFAYPGITTTQINSLLGAVGGLTPQTATALDTAYATATNYTTTSGPGATLFTNLLAQLVAAHTGGQSVTWAGQQIANNPNFWTTYAGLNPTGADATEFTTITGVSIPAVPPPPFSLQAIATAVATAVASSTFDGSKNFAKDFEAAITNSGAKNAADLVNFLTKGPYNPTTGQGILSQTQYLNNKATPNAPNGYAEPGQGNDYNGIDIDQTADGDLPAIVAAINGQITGSTITLPAPTVLDQAYFAKTGWANEPTSTAGKRFFKDLLTEMENLWASGTTDGKALNLWITENAPTAGLTTDETNELQAITKVLPANPPAPPFDLSAIATAIVNTVTAQGTAFAGSKNFALDLELAIKNSGKTNAADLVAFLTTGPYVATTGQGILSQTQYLNNGATPSAPNGYADSGQGNDYDGIDMGQSYMTGDIPIFIAAINSKIYPAHINVPVPTVLDQAYFAKAEWANEPTSTAGKRFFKDLLTEMENLWASKTTDGKALNLWITENAPTAGLTTDEINELQAITKVLPANPPAPPFDLSAIATAIVNAVTAQGTAFTGSKNFALDLELAIKNSGKTNAADLVTFLTTGPYVATTGQGILSQTQYLNNVATPNAPSGYADTGQGNDYDGIDMDQSYASGDIPVFIAAINSQIYPAAHINVLAPTVLDQAYFAMKNWATEPKSPSGQAFFQGTLLNQMSIFWGSGKTNGTDLLTWINGNTPTGLTTDETNELNAIKAALTPPLSSSNITHAVWLKTWGGGQTDDLMNSDKYTKNPDGTYTFTGSFPPGTNLVNIFEGRIDYVNGKWVIDDIAGNMTPSGVPPTPAQLTAYAKAAHAQGVKVNISIGGWGGQDKYNKTWDQLTDANAAQMGKDIADYMASIGLDGVDFDYEESLSGTENKPQEAQVGQMIGNFKHQSDVNGYKLMTILDTDGGNSANGWGNPDNYGHQAPTQAVMDAATTTYQTLGGTGCPIDLLSIMSYDYKIPSGTEDADESFLQSWLKFAAHYGMNPSQVSIGIDPTDGSMTSDQQKDLMQWSAKQGLSTALWDQMDSNEQSHTLKVYNDYNTPS